MHKPTVYFLVGPTASGKTAVSIQLAEMMNAEIISADSIQVYKGLDIGSAKPTLAERAGIPHHMLDVADITERGFSVAKYREMAENCIWGIVDRGKRPLVVGGTGLYVHALTHVLHFAESAGDEVLRGQLRKEEMANPGALYQRLRSVDPEAARRIHANDQKRVIRALEVYLLSGKTMTERGVDFHNQDAEIPYAICMAGLTMERALLYARIDQRVDQMIENGLLNEAQALHDAGYNGDLPALQGLGYKQLSEYFSNPAMYRLEDCIDAVKRDTRRFAKRQWTWFKRDKRIQWVTILPDDDLPSITKRVYEILVRCEGEGEKSHAKG